MQSIITRLLSTIIHNSKPLNLSNDDLVQVLSLSQWKNKKICFAKTGSIRNLFGVKDLCHFSTLLTEEIGDLDQI